MEKKKKMILNYSLWRLLAYFVIYSVIGYVIETLFCIVKYGVWESRQSFLYGPFCAIYGIGAIVMILCLQYFKKNYMTLFFGGCVVGSVVEYVLSWAGEMILHVRWWDYSEVPLNLNGRICLLYSIFWGFLALSLIISINPKVDKLINFIKKKLSPNMIKMAVIAIVIWMLVDMLLTAYAIMYFMVRTIANFDIEVENKQEIVELYNTMYSNPKKTELIYKFFGDKKMLTTFPRLKVSDVNGDVVFFSDLLPDIQPYYYKVWNK
jgi:uncharacterized membrane protein